MDAQKILLKQKMEELSESIESFAIAIAVNDTGEKDRLYPLCIAQIQLVFPLIIQYYTRPEMKPYEQELKEWSDQLTRIMQAIRGRDMFFMVDVLKFETRENLIYLQDLMDKTA